MSLIGPPYSSGLRVIRRYLSSLLLFLFRFSLFNNYLHIELMTDYDADGDVVVEGRRRWSTRCAVLIA